MRLTATQQKLLSQAVRGRGQGTGLTVRASNRRACGRMVVNGLLRITRVYDEPSGRDLTVLVPTDFGDAVLANAQQQVSA